jgi:hypothetical protein
MFGVVHSYMTQETVRDAQNMREQEAQTNLEFRGIISANPLGEVLGVATLPVCFVWACLCPILLLLVHVVQLRMCWVVFG